MLQNTFGNTTSIGDYKFGKYISSGSYGSVYQVFDESDGLFVVKLERNEGAVSLVFEFFVLSTINNFIKKTDPTMQLIPKAHTIIIEKSRVGMIIDFCGLSFSGYIQSKGLLVYDMIVNVFRQLILTLKYVMLTGFVHCDIKPANIMIDDLGVVRLIDFGLAQRLRREDDTLYQSLQFRERQFRGTISYCSIDQHKGAFPAFRNDIESICYTCIYLFKGRLPWSNCVINSASDKQKVIRDFKIKYSSEKETLYNNLCGNMPTIIPRALEMALHNNTFKNATDYDYLLNYVEPKE